MYLKIKINNVNKLTVFLHPLISYNSIICLGFVPFYILGIKSKRVEDGS